MTVSEKNVSDALIYLADDPHPIAKARHALTLAENKVREIFAEEFLIAEGSVGMREARAQTSIKYREAKAEEAEAVLEYERHKSRVKAAEMLLDIWRTENANIRAAERIR